jgi:excisionase family DNA binding protein
MVSFNSPSNFQKSYDGVVISQHITVLAAAEATGYNIQYLRRILRSGALKGVKIGQTWLIEMEALETYLKHVETTSDRRCGPR